MKKAFKTELILTDEQHIKLNKTIGVGRYVYNMYLAKTKEVYDQTGKFLSGMDFSKWLNNVHLPEHDTWIKEVSSKAVKQAIMNGDGAFRSFFKGKSKYPKFKKKKNQDVKAYFPKNNPTDLTVERHRIKVPTLGWVRLKEYGYIPTNAKVSSCTLSIKAGRCFISVLCDVAEPNKAAVPEHDGIGIDVGIKDFAVCSHHQVFANINKTPKVKQLEKQLKREQRALSRSYEMNKTKKTADGYVLYQNRGKRILRIQQLHERLSRIRKEYIRFIVSQLVKTKPTYMTVEDLNVRGMMKNRHLSKAIAQQSFYYFLTYLTQKCGEYGIELRQVSRFYPSSKKCSGCGEKKPKLSLSERTYKCDHCDLEMDRDYNASLNLKDATAYTLLT